MSWLIIDSICILFNLIVIWIGVRKGFIGILLELFVLWFVIYTFSKLYSCLQQIFGFEYYQLAYIIGSVIYYYIVSYIVNSIFYAYVDTSVFVFDSIIGVLLCVFLVMVLSCFIFVIINFIYNIRAADYSLNSIIVEQLMGSSLIYNRVAELLFEINEKNLPLLFYNSICFNFFVHNGRYFFLKLFYSSFYNYFFKFIRYINL